MAIVSLSLVYNLTTTLSLNDVSECTICERNSYNDDTFYDFVQTSLYFLI